MDMALLNAHKQFKMGKLLVLVFLLLMHKIF